jgi:23S rRNA pseudouridine1911/1915/1917 synthase
MMPFMLVAEPGRLDAVLARLTGVPRADVQRAIAGGRVTVDGEQKPKSHRLSGGERLDVSGLEATALVPEDVAVSIRFQDEHLLIVVKPAGVVTHPTAARRTGTFVNRLLGAGVPLSGLGGDLRPGIVHRLDAGTSGLLLVAKTDEAHEAIASMMRNHSVERRYLALVRGRVERDVFAVDAPLGRRAARIVVDRTGGKVAETAFRVMERLPRATLLEASPRTGRTHQIRVHLAAVGHPVLGDRPYGGAGEEAERIGLTRTFLHAWRLTLNHPITQRRLDVEEPLPADLADALDRARADRTSPPGGRSGGGLAAHRDLHP